MYIPNICCNFAAEIDMIMKKEYIQPNFELTELITDHMMLPGSPTGGEYDPLKQTPAHRAPVLGNDSVPVF